MEKEEIIVDRYREESPDGKITTYVTIYADGRIRREECRYVAGRLFGNPKITITYPDGTSVTKKEYKWATVWEITHPDGTVEKREAPSGVYKDLQWVWESSRSGPYIPDDKVELEDLDVHGF